MKEEPNTNTNGTINGHQEPINERILQVRQLSIEDSFAKRKRLKTSHVSSDEVDEDLELSLSIPTFESRDQVENDAKEQAKRFYLSS